MLKSRTSKLLDKKILDLMKLIQVKKFWAIALTAPNTERATIITHFEDFLIQELNALGIDFCTQSPTDRNHSLKSFSGKYYPPIHKKGIIFTKNIEKTPALKQFLFEFQVKPTHIIFIDNQRKNLISIEKMCKEKNILFSGFLYTKGYKSPPPYNKKISQMQLLTLQKENTWLNDGQAWRKIKLVKEFCEDLCL